MRGPARQSDQPPLQQPAPLECTFCGYQIPGNVSPQNDADQPFCSEPCREAFEDGREQFRGDLGFKRRPVDVPALQPALPEGIPGNAAVLLAGQEGTQTEGILLEWIWRALRYGGPAAIVSVDKPPSVLVESFLAHGWNVLPYLHQRDLVILDTFTARLEADSEFSRHGNRWNSYVEDAFDDGFVDVRDPADLRAVSHRLDDTLEDLGMTDRGVVAIDSLTDFASITQEVQAANFLREARATVCKSRYVPLLAAASVPRTDDLYPTDYPHDHEYLFDGIVDLELNDDLVDGQRIDRLSVRKMANAPVHSDWIPYEYSPGAGYVPVSLPTDQQDEDVPAPPAFGSDESPVGRQPGGGPAGPLPPNGGSAPRSGSAPKGSSAPTSDPAPTRR